MIEVWRGMLCQYEDQMNHTLAVSTYVFVTVFGFLAAITLGLRALFGCGRRSTPSLPPFIPNETLVAREWPPRKAQDHLAPPPVSRDDLDYHHTSDYVLDPNSPYSISPPPQRDEDRW